MSRPPLPVGSWGDISVARNGEAWTARARFRDFDGVTRQVTRSAKTKGAARTALLDALTARTTPATDDLTPSTKVAVLLEQWHAEHTADKAAQTKARYRDAIRAHLTPGIGQLSVSECTVPALDRFLKTVAVHSGASAAMMCRVVLTGAFGLAVRHGAVKTNPVTHTAPIRRAQKEPRGLTPDEVLQVRQAIGEWQKGIRPDGTRRAGRPPAQDLLNVVDLMLGTGARVGELLAIRWPDVDQQAGTLDITGTIVRRATKPATCFRQDHPKTSSSRQRLMLPGFALDALTRQAVLLPAANVGDLVFPSEVGGVRDPNSVRKQLTKALTPVGLGWVTPHVFRKTVATVLDRETDLSTASAQLGHAGTGVTSRHYVERAAMGPDVREVLDRLLGG